MSEIAEKRVYDERGGATTLVVASTPGLVTIAVSDAQVGEFGLELDCAPMDLAVCASSEPAYRLAVATDSDVLLAGSRSVGSLEETGFGPAGAVTFAAGEPRAAGLEGRLARYDGAEWRSIGELPGPATAIAGDLVGTAEGVIRVVDGALKPAGLTAVVDVARAAGLPLVATELGVYELGNGWLDVLDGDASLVTGAPDGRAHAVVDGACFTRTDAGWERLELPSEQPVAAVAYGSRDYLVTTAGELLTSGPDGWSQFPLGLEGVVAAAVL